MSLISYLQNKGATHLFTLSNEGTDTSHDLGNSPTPTLITGGNYSFVANPVFYGFTHCLRTTNNSNSATDGAIIENRRDINNGSSPSSDSSSYNYPTGTRTLILASRQLHIWNPTCLYEQGGGTNNFAFMGGAQTTFQAADAGQPFLISSAKTLAQKNRSKLLIGVWEHHSQHSGSGNRILFYENGVLQSIEELNGTDNFPGHSGDIVVGNASDNLKSFNETTFQSQTVEKDSNLLAMFNNKSFTAAECRELFERIVIGEVVITGTVEQQQSQIDALSGNTYKDINCAIEIRQATDQQDYTLTLDNINFIQNQNLNDIAIKFVGTGNLEIINVNGSNAEITCAPLEQDLDGATILQGGGTITVTNTIDLTIQGMPIGYEYNLFLKEANSNNIIGNKVKESESHPGGDITYRYTSAEINKNLVIQVFDDVAKQEKYLTIFLGENNNTYILTL